MLISIQIYFATFGMSLSTILDAELSNHTELIFTKYFNSQINETRQAIKQTKNTKNKIK